MANQTPVSTSNNEEPRRSRRMSTMRNSKQKDPDGLRGSLLEKRRRESTLASNEEESFSTTNSNSRLNSSLPEKQRSRRGGEAASNDEESRQSKDPDGLRGSLLKKQKSRRGGGAASPRRRHTVAYSRGDLLGEEAAASSPTRSHAADYSLGDRLLISDLRQFRSANSGESLTPKGRVFVRRADRTYTCAEFDGVNRQGMLRFRVDEAGSFKAICPKKLSSHVLVPTTGCDSPGCDSRTVETSSPPSSPVVAKSDDEIHASVPEQELEKIHKVGDCVIYQGRGGLSLATIHDVYLDDQLSPYYYIKLQDGSERQTDNEHICLADPSYFGEGKVSSKKQ